MAHTRRTLALNSDWDVTVNEAGGISLLEGAQATAQNVANEARLFTEDAYLIQDRGTPYWVVTLGQKVATTALRNYMRKSALRVDDVKTVTAVSIDGFDTGTRQLTGEIQFTTVEDETSSAVL